MLLINAELKASPIQGTGLFSRERLHEGRIIWVLHRKFDSVFSAEEWAILSPVAKEYLRTYMYWSKRQKKYVACLDNSRHMNHAELPNTMSVFYPSLDEVPSSMLLSAGLTDEQWSQVDISEGFTVAVRTIESAEELVCNYERDFPDEGGAQTQDFLGKT